MESKKTIMIIVNDLSGVLQRITSLTTRRGFNIESITVGPSEKKGLSRIIIVTTCSNNLANQIVNQISKLIDVHQATILSADPLIAGELAFIKINVESDMHKEVFKVIQAFQTAVVDKNSNTMIIQAVEETDKINTLIDILTPYGICEVSRTGTTAISV